MTFTRLAIHGLRMLMPFLDRIVLRALILFGTTLTLCVLALLALAGVAVAGGSVSTRCAPRSAPSRVSLGVALILLSEFSNTRGVRVGLPEAGAMPTAPRRGVSTTGHPPTGATLRLPQRVVAWWAAQNRPRWERVGAVAYIGGLTLLFFAALFGGKTLSNIPGAQLFLAPWQHQPYSFPYPQADQAYFFYPYTLVQTHAWRAGTIPFWNPYNLGGIALLANGQSGILYPIRILLALFVSPSWNHDLFVVGHMVVGGLFMFAF